MTPASLACMGHSIYLTRLKQNNINTSPDMLTWPSLAVAAAAAVLTLLLLSMWFSLSCSVALTSLTTKLTVSALQPRQQER